MNRLSVKLYKIVNYEFWAWYMIYIPLLPVYLFGVLYTRKLLYFTAANPSIDMGGFFGERKSEIMDLIPSSYVVKSIHVTRIHSSDSLAKIIEEAELTLPLILKPNVGERGEGVKLCLTIEDLFAYGESQSDYLIQEYVDYPLEIGVLYSKLPCSSGGEVTSIVQKEFLSVCGDGQSTVYQLLQKHKRNRLYLAVVRERFSDRLDVVVPKDENFIIHKIGNHVLGTKFIDMNRHMSSALNEAFTELGNQIEGVFYGRFDLKVPSYADLEKGKNIKIFELNGVSADPGHIYDQKNVFIAYGELAKHWLQIIHISKQNIKKGVKITPFSKFIIQVKNHFLA